MTTYLSGVKRQLESWQKVHGRGIKPRSTPAQIESASERIGFLGVLLRITILWTISSPLALLYSIKTKDAISPFDVDFQFGGAVFMVDLHSHLDRLQLKLPPNYLLIPI